MLKAVYLKYGFAFDEPEALANGTVAEITMNPLLLGRAIVFDETEFRLGNDSDVGGTRAGTYANASLNRGGSRHTRSNNHVTGGLAVSMAGEALPPLVIFSSSAEKEENLAANDAWVKGFGKTKGKYGHKRFVERMPYISVRKTGSMDVRLFMEYVENVTKDLFPEGSITLEIKLDDHGRLISGPVLWTVDTGPGRLTSNQGEFARVWDEWAKKMHEQGIIICGLLPNSTTVSAVMDELYRAFKIATRKATQTVFAAKVKANAKAVQKLKLEIAQQLAQGEEVPEKRRSKVTAVASLNPGDLGEILYGKLDENGYANPSSPMAEAFTKEKILAAFEKVSIYLLLFFFVSYQ